MVERNLYWDRREFNLWPGQKGAFFRLLCDYKTSVTEYTNHGKEDVNPISILLSSSSRVH